MNYHHTNNLCVWLLGKLCLCMTYCEYSFVIEFVADNYLITFLNSIPLWFVPLSVIDIPILICLNRPSMIQEEKHLFGLNESI